MMKVYFANNRLRRCFEDSGRARREWGTAVANKYIQRIHYILDTPDFAELRKIRFLRLHPLRGKLAGRFAIDLNNRWRIILTYIEDEEAVRILEVTNHYGD